MNVKVADLMVESVMTTSPTQTVGHVREVMARKRINSMPVVGEDGEPVGILTSTDLLDDPPDATPVAKVMSTKVYTVPRYSDVSEAARIMRNHHLHHVIVTHEKRIVGILSAFDLLKLVEKHRFVMKNAPSTKKTRRRSGGRPETEIGGSD